MPTIITTTKNFDICLLATCTVNELQINGLPFVSIHFLFSSWKADPLMLHKMLYSCHIFMHTQEPSQRWWPSWGWSFCSFILEMRLELLSSFSPKQPTENMWTRRHKKFCSGPSWMGQLCTGSAHTFASEFPEPNMPFPKMWPSRFECHDLFVQFFTYANFENSAGHWLLENLSVCNFSSWHFYPLLSFDPPVKYLLN